MSARVAALALGLAALLPVTAGAQQRWERQVRERLARAVSTLRDATAQTLVTHDGPLNTEDAAAWRVTLQEEVAYAIVAVCDDDCTRLELSLLTPSGSELAKDRNSESFPVIRVVAPRTLAYGVRVVMDGCRWNPCWYAVAVVPLGKRGPSQ